MGREHDNSRPYWVAAKAAKKSKVNSPESDRGCFIRNQAVHSILIIAFLSSLCQ